MRFPNLHVTEAIKRPQKGSLEGLGAKAPTCKGGAGGCVPSQEGEGEGEEGPEWGLH